MQQIESNKKMGNATSPAAINQFYCQTRAFHNQILPGSEDNEKRVYNTSNIHYNVLWYTTNKFYQQELVTNNSDETIGVSTFQSIV